MESRELGKSGVHLTALGLGCMGMSEFYGPRDDEQSVRVIHRAVELGINFIDTADMYGVGHNEELVGRAIRDRRDKVFLATKFGNVRTAGGGFGGIRGDPQYVRSACEASLKRLGIESIDLYYQHRVDPNTPIETTVQTMAALVKEGKVKYLGLSEAGAATMRKAHGVHPIAALQSEYSLWSRDVEDEILPTCRELGIGFVAYSPLGRGFLTGQIKKIDDLAEDDRRRAFPRFQPENFNQNLKLVKIIVQIANQKKCKPSQIALAWVMAQGKDVIPIPGTKKLNYLEENIAAANVRLSTDEIQCLSAALSPDAPSGTRYPEAGMAALNR